MQGTPPPPPMTKRASAAQRGYDSRWQRYRRSYLRANPLCAFCLKAGQTTVATVVDHIQPHRGDHRLFWNPENHQPLCKKCHDQDKQRLEKSGRVMGCDIDGNPIDPRHHWSA